MSSDIPIPTTGFGGSIFVSLRAYAVVVSSTTNTKRAEIFKEEGTLIKAIKRSVSVNIE